MTTQKSDKSKSAKVKTKRPRQSRGGDPDGSLGVARGLTPDELNERRIQLMEGRSEGDKQLVNQYLEGPNSYQSKQRQSLLKYDDANMKTDSLREPQKRALAKRQGRENKIVGHRLERHEYQRLMAATAAADAQVVLHTEDHGLVEAENDMERTTGLSQVELKNKHLSAQTAQHIYDLNMENYSPYGMKYDRSGRCALLFGQAGHVSMMDCHLRSLVTEFHLPGERVRDACFLHNATMFAVAQKNYAYIYDNTGAEIHELKDHIDPMALDFLSHHWLLVSVGRSGWLKYHDTSTGDLVTQHRTRLGSCNVMRQNSSNGIMHLGHHNGTVTLWSPSSQESLVKMLCHKGSPVTSLVVSDNVMVTGGADRQVKVWDLRMFKQTHAYFSSAGVPTSLDISQRGVLGVGHAGHATFWRPEALRVKEKDPYMNHQMQGCSPVQTLRFRPFEDVCGIGHAKGVSSIVIPGSGEPNLDTSEYNTNPFQDNKQRREAEVRSLLDKLSPDMICLDPDIVGTVEASDPHLRQERLQDIQEEANNKAVKKKKQKNKKRGRSKIQTQLRRKSRNVIDNATVKLREARDAEEKMKKEVLKSQDATEKAPENDAPAALRRFFK